MFLFHKDGNLTYALPSCSDSFFRKYLDVFDSVKVLGAPMESYLDKSALVQMQDKRISVEILAPNTRPKDFINDSKVRQALEKEIKKAEAILIKPASRRGIMAIKIAKKYNKPYMIEMTGDIHNALKQHPNFFKRMYAPFLYKKILNSIKDCKYGLYVSQEYLQHEFPIEGKMCGCSDVVLEKADEVVLEKRLKKIDSYSCNAEIKLALIGFYQGKMKGVDTAIRALAHLSDRFQLYILGVGTEENRKNWYEYAKVWGVSEKRIHFATPLPSSIEVLHWLDSVDAFVFPTRSEGFGRCVAEAMSRGCPCFATNICTMPELLSKETLFDMGDDKKLAELLIEYFSNKESLKKLAKRNFEKCNEYDFDVLKLRRNKFLEEFRRYAECVLK